MTNYFLNVAIAAFALLGSASSFLVSLPTASRGGLSTATRSQHLTRPLPHRNGDARQLLRAQPGDGENLRPDVAQAMEEMEKEAKGTIEQLVGENKVMLFMKGNKMFPQCGFSNSAIQVLRACDVEFETYDVLSNQGVREAVKEYSNWPTIPQLYIDGEFTGGADIMIESFQSGELKKTLEDAGCKFVSEG